MKKEEEKMMNGSISKMVSVLFLVLLVAFVVMAPVSPKTSAFILGGKLTGTLIKNT